MHIILGKFAKLCYPTPSSLADHIMKWRKRVETPFPIFYRSGFFVWKVQATVYCLYFEAEGHSGNLHNFFFNIFVIYLDAVDTVHCVPNVMPLSFSFRQTVKREGNTQFFCAKIRIHWLKKQSLCMHYKRLLFGVKFNLFSTVSYTYVAHTDLWARYCKKELSLKSGWVFF